MNLDFDLSLGAAPGDYKRYEKTDSSKETIFRLCRYTQEQFIRKEYDTLESLSREIPLKSEGQVTWIDIQNFDAKKDGQKLEDLFAIHPLTLEDLFNYNIQPKYEEYDEYYFVLLKVIGSTKRETYNLGILLFQNLVISISHKVFDPMFEPIFQRLGNGVSKIRRKSADYLFIALLDLVIDTYSLQVKQFVQKVESLERKLFDSNDFIDTIRPIRKQILWYRSVLRPTKEIFVKLSLDNVDRILEGNFKYVQDTTEHLVFLVSQIDDVKETSLDAINLYLSLSSQKMNEVMKVLTLITSIFIPLSFVAGVYGMNFNQSASPWNMPELSSPWGYPVVIGFMLIMASSCLYWFKRKKWL